MIENPIYGGAYAYGKTAVEADYGTAGVSRKIHRKGRSDWLALMPNAHEGYISWEKAETIRNKVSSNVPGVRATWRSGYATVCKTAALADIPRRA